MGLFSVLKTLVIPAIISLVLYLSISYVFVPVWKRYRSRYGQYLPLDTISIQTSSLRHRILDTMVQYLLPSSWRSQLGRDRYALSAQDGSGSDFDEEEGEELYDVDDHRREALSLDARRGRDDDSRRLSRDLEEGFKDDSEEDDSDNSMPNGAVTSRTASVLRCGQPPGDAGGAKDTATGEEEGCFYKAGGMGLIVGVPYKRYTYLPIVKRQRLRPSSARAMQQQKMGGNCSQ
ncbi:hypothetical protein JHW43_006816 [Diplocarpon mali]|nr:hypothetical protein JHW43_006816 [Diplocarpon mali]